MADPTFSAEDVIRLYEFNLTEDEQLTVKKFFTEGPIIEIQDEVRELRTTGITYLKVSTRILEDLNDFLKSFKLTPEGRQRLQDMFNLLSVFENTFRKFTLVDQTAGNLGVAIFEAVNFWDNIQDLLQLVVAVPIVTSETAGEVAFTLADVETLEGSIDSLAEKWDLYRLELLQLMEGQDEISRDEADELVAELIRDRLGDL